MGFHPTHYKPSALTSPVHSKVARARDHQKSPPWVKSRHFRLQSRCLLCAVSGHGQPLPFNYQAEPALLSSVGVCNSSSPTTAILAPPFLSEPSRLGRRPSTCDAGCEESPSSQRHSHNVLPYWEAADKRGSPVLHRGLPSGLPAPPQWLPKHVRLSPRLDRPYRSTALAAAQSRG
jgi:hypothetical protein